MLDSAARAALGVSQVSFVQIGPPKFDPSVGPPCHDCTARCCRYFALEIDAPVTPRDHDHIRWYLLHEHIAVWKLEGSWFLEVRTPCRHLRADNGCAIYETRPEICRTYGWPDDDNRDTPCDYFSHGGGYELYFETAEAFDAWSCEALARREARLARRRAAAKRERAAAGRRDRKAIA